MKRLVGATLAALAFGACGPAPEVQAQLVLVVETDAPIPGAHLAEGELALFDRLRVSIQPQAAATSCAGCEREFVLDTERPDPLSIGIAGPTTGAVAKVELFASRNANRDGLPDEGSSLVAWVHLPRPDAHERRSIYVTLRLLDLAHPQSTREAPIEPSITPESPPPTRFPGAVRVPCSAPVAANEACVPGALAWMGDAARTPGPAGGLPPRLVQMPPFVIDRDEVSVRAFRASGLAGSGDPEVNAASLCTYSPQPGANDDAPVNCISWSMARSYCVDQGKDLPTEAELEYVEGGLQGTRFPWGNDDPRCAGITFGRGAAGMCPGTGPSAVGTSTSDVLVIGDASIHDLAGNVEEWSREVWTTPQDACNAQGFVTDPRCPIGPATLHPTRGGAYALDALAARAYVRLPQTGQSNLTGLRCARELPAP